MEIITLIANSLGIMILWFIGMLLVPTLAGFISIWLFERNADGAITVFWVTFTLYWIATGLILAIL